MIMASAALLCNLSNNGSNYYYDLMSVTADTYTHNFTALALYQPDTHSREMRKTLIRET